MLCIYILIVLSCLVQLSAGKKDYEICSIFAIEENASLLLETGSRSLCTL